MTHRGTSNGNSRGSSYNRRVRRQWLVQTFRADVDIVQLRFEGGRTEIIPELLPGVMVDVEHVQAFFPEAVVEQIRACRCYRCGKLLTEDTVTVDRIIPGCKGGTYRRNNIRPACDRCNSETGGQLGNAQKKAKAAPKRVRANA